MKVGFIGLGRMGSAIAGRVLAAGHELVVYNRTAAKAAELEKAGAKVAGSVDAACAAREVVVTMLADDAALEQVAHTPGGLVQSLPVGAVHMVMGTHGVGTIRSLAAAHAEAGQAPADDVLPLHHDDRRSSGLAGVGSCVSPRGPGLDPGATYRGAFLRTAPTLWTTGWTAMNVGGLLAN